MTAGHPKIVLACFVLILLISIDEEDNFIYNRAWELTPDVDDGTRDEWLEQYL